MHGAFLALGLYTGGDVLRREPTVVTSGWAEGVHDEVKARRVPPTSGLLLQLCVRRGVSSKC